MTELKNCTSNFLPELCGVNVVIDPRGRLGSDDDRVLIIGQIGTGATAAPGSVTPVSDSTSAALYGANSMLTRMIKDFQAGCPNTEIYAYAVANTGTAGQSDITFAGTAAAATSGAAHLWVNGFTYSESFDPTVDTDTTLAAKFAAAITARQPYITATSAAGVLSLDTKDLGVIGGQLDVRKSYSLQSTFVSSPDVTVTIVNTAPTGLPSLSAISGLTEGFEFVANPYTDDASMDAVSAYLCSQWTGGTNSRAYGVKYGDAVSGTVFGQNANNALFSYMNVDGALTPSYLETASYACLAYRQLNCASPDIAASLTGLRMPAMLAPEVADRFSDFEKAALVESGMGYFDVNRVNDVIIGRAVTTYTVADNGTLDTSFREVNRPAMTACISRIIRNELTARYTGYAFRRDGVVGRGSEKVATIASIRSFMIGLGQRLSDRNLIQDIEGFVDSLSVVFNDDTGCISITIDPQLVEQFCCVTVTLRTI